MDKIKVLNKNIFIVLIILAVLLWTFNFMLIASYADTYLNLPSSLSNEYIVIKDNNDYIIIDFDDTPYTGNLLFSENTFDAYYAFAGPTKYGNTSVYTSTDDGQNWTLENTRWKKKLNSYTYICYSTFDLYNGSGSVFFSKALVPQPSLMVRTMANTPRTLLLGSILVGLIPILGLVILAISFRKAWAFLQNQLQH